MCAQEADQPVLPNCQSNLLLDIIASISLINTLHHSTTSFFLTRSDSRFRTWRAKTSKSDGRDSKNHNESFSHPSTQRCWGNCKQVFVVASVPAQVFKTNYPALQNFKSTSIIRLMGFFSGHSINFLPEPTGVGQDNRSLGGARGISFIAFVHHGWLAGIFPCPP